MSTLPTAPQAAAERSRGRAYLWAGVAACLLGLALPLTQWFVLKQLSVPWYALALVTAGPALVLISVVRRRTALRVVVLLLLVAFAARAWHGFLVRMRLPDYEGPARAGLPFPAFHSALADGRAFTDADLRDGSRRAMVFFRGRW